ncbi:hypothetical protein ACGFYY_36610 [Streptomyces sp. NPDC048331]|uniref:hypothetical protein n=1 Tax=Streptomyces sp. NPDC048331 TaxID=3365534 RepID=UPI00371A680A
MPAAAPPSFDLAVGFTPSALNKGLAQLHSTHRDVFKGTDKKNYSDVTYFVSWDFLSPPALRLGALPDQLWENSIKAPGVKELPATGVMLLELPEVKAAAWPADQASEKVGGTGPVRVICHATVKDKALAVEPLAAWIDQSSIDAKDKRIVRHQLVPSVLAMAGKLLGGLHIPTAELFGTKVALEPSLVDATGTHLVLAASAKVGGAAAADLAGHTWPDKEIFVLGSRTFLTSLLGAALRSHQNTEVYRENKGPEALNVTLTAKFKEATNLVLDEKELTKGSAQLLFGFAAEVFVLGVGSDGCSMIKAGSDC